MHPVNKILLIVLAGWFAASQFTSAQTWTATSAPGDAEYVTSIACSADGDKLIALASSWKYYVSTNAGATWTTNTEPQQGADFGSWPCLAASADGNKLVAMGYGVAWTSTNGGTTWVSNTVAGAEPFLSVASSADGTKLVTAEGESAGGLIYTSTDSGTTWNPANAPGNYWRSVASSADGTKLAAVAFGSAPFPIYLSTNSGVDWFPAGASSNNIWTCVASSADGMKLVAAAAPLLINSNPQIYAPAALYTSTNGGATWTATNSPGESWKTNISPGLIWSGVASSADGDKLVAVSQGGSSPIFTSTNYGVTWISNTSPNALWMAVASSADGAKLAAISWDNGDSYQHVCTSQSTPSPQLNLAPTNGIKLSWIVPSTKFVVQWSSDLSAGNWQNVTNGPVLNLTNLQDEVSLTGTNQCGFFRLKTP